MVLNYIWLAFFFIAFIVALVKLIFWGDTQIFSQLVKQVFDMSDTAFRIALFLTGILTFWLGVMKVGERAGLVQFLAKLLRPLFRRIFPQVPDGHPALGSITMNIADNMLGLDNAATTMGLKAMEQLQELNTQKDTASDAQIMFLVLNTSGLTIIPISIMAYRAQMGAQNPTDVFIPILIATFFSTMVGLIVTALIQKLKIWDWVVLAYLGGFSLIIAGLIAVFLSLPPEKMQIVSDVATGVILFSIIIGFLFAGFVKKRNVYEDFIDGAKEGFAIAVKIIPYLVAILVAIAVFRASGAMDYLIAGLEKFFKLFHMNTDFVPALPTAFMKPLSGSGARAMMIEAMKTYGPDSFVGHLASIIQGSTDTTFYVLAVYFGAVGIKNSRYAVVAGLAADFAGIVAAIIIGYIMFG
jgi:spore maturation protein SpmA